MLKVIYDLIIEKKAQTVIVCFKQVNIIARLVLLGNN